MALPDGATRRVHVRRIGPHEVELSEVSGGTERVFRAAILVQRGAVSVSFRGQVYRFESPEATGLGRAAATNPASGMLMAPMTGAVAAVLVAEGDEVAAFQPLVSVEAMKVVATLEAPFAGVVKRLHVSPGEHVEHGAPLVAVEPEGETAGDGS